MATDDFSAALREVARRRMATPPDTDIPEPVKLRADRIEAALQPLFNDPACRPDASRDERKPVYNKARGLKEFLEGLLNGDNNPHAEVESPEFRGSRRELRDHLLGLMHAEGMETRNWSPKPSGIDPEAERLINLADKLRREREEREAHEVRGPVDLGWSEAGPGSLNHDFREYNS